MNWVPGDFHIGLLSWFGCDPNQMQIMKMQEGNTATRDHSDCGVGIVLQRNDAGAYIVAEIMIQGDFQRYFCSQTL